MGYVEDGIFVEKSKLDKELKTVFLIGDSLRMGYCETVKKELSDVANVVFPEDNCRFTQYILLNLEDWATMCDGQKVDVVQFNCGHWDAAHFGGEEESLNSLEVYGHNIGRIIKKIHKIFPEAKVVFATSTPMNPNGSQGRNPRTSEELKAYNEKALEVCGEDVYINDIYGMVCGYDESMFADYAHLTEAGFEEVGKKVAAFLRELL